MKKVLQLFFVLCLAMQIHAQEKTITGIVSDVNGLPLPTATVLVQGTTNGTSTDFEGKYTIKANIGDILVYTYVGYVPTEKTVGASNTIHVSLQPNTSLDEVVVTAIGIKREEKTLGHTSQNIVNSLSGKVSGVSVNASRHKQKVKRLSNAKPFRVENKFNNPGCSTRIVIRGNTSISKNHEPLVIIDGVVLDNSKPKSNKENKTSGLADLNKEDIKTISVIKGSEATSLYGVQGANGVLIIQTKKGNYTLPKPIKQAIKKSIKKQPQDIAKTHESYEEIVENNFETTVSSPLSTFSIDVDKASYSNVRRMINKAQHIPADAVKIEEMVNYFDYNYPEPTAQHPFAIHTEFVVTPWNKDTRLVKIGLQGKMHKNEELPPSNLTFLIDVSGSMRAQNKLPLLKSAFKLLVNQLREQDRVSIVVYAGAAGVVLEPTSGKDKEKILTALNKLQSGGATAGGEGIELAYALAQKNFKKNGNNRVILATDGDFNVGASSDKDMQTLIEEKRKSGVFLSVLGFGYGNYKDSKLETLADKGNGNHAFIDTMQEAQKVFGKEFGGTLYTIAKDVKIQVEFNPNKVQAYRLIGYENRLLADEDFIDDSKDAGELGSGHTVTALYEVIPVGVKSAYLKDVTDLKYTKKEVSTNFQDELLTVKFRYKKPEGEKSIEMVHIQKDKVVEASQDMQFAASVALFGMQLRYSQYHNNSKIEDVISLAESGRGKDKFGYRAEFIRLVTSYQNI
ncbi:von Willebrand factor type A domain-containing protein [Lacinutrix sp. C3R15]|uniref:vWA domain-containing protein n=1 Tax=Flavobacteriaceae TaxID=49546 RepID=UPI001C09C538|nr:MULTISPECIES: VWA domain-containing protein [Flavobacteriaceae]MBU2938749.1 von Willebrand factor type A domain-containing protein [Lacinutrix sp. C3R15]MDO6622062.1 von Willebrand factor type A domain-containing protein [Oceanihabitans sp. 1_MG-2023]